MFLLCLPSAAVSAVYGLLHLVDRKCCVWFATLLRRAHTMRAGSARLLPAARNIACVLLRCRTSTTPRRIRRTVSLYHDAAPLRGTTPSGFADTVVCCCTQLRRLLFHPLSPGIAVAIPRAGAVPLRGDARRGQHRDIAA